jgi:hypothetical protein
MIVPAHAEDVCRVDEGCECDMVDSVGSPPRSLQDGMKPGIGRKRCLEHHPDPPFLSQGRKRMWTPRGCSPNIKVIHVSGGHSRLRIVTGARAGKFL